MVSKRFSWAWFFSTCGGLGEIPKGSGTLASMVAVFFWAALEYYSGLDWIVPVLSLLLVPLGVWSARALDRERNMEDSSAVVIDEWIGMGLALSFVPMTTTAFAIAFILFRVFDISKPPGVRFFDQNYLKGWGVILDDVVAGMYVAILFGVQRWLL